MRAFQRLAAASVAVALAITVTACSKEESGGTQSSSGGGSNCNKPYKVGVMLGLTGPYAAVAEPQKKTLDLFAEQLKQKGGINGHQVQFTTVDTRGDEGEAVNVTRKLATQDQVIGIVGPSSSGEAIAIKPIVDSLKVPTMAIAGSDTIIAQPAVYMFKEFTSGIDSLKAQLSYLKEQGMTKVGMLYSNNAYGQEPAKALPGLAKENGLEVVATEAVPADATNATSQLSKVAKANPDAILVWAVLPGPAVVAKNAQALKLKPQLFMAPGAASGAYLELGGDAADGTLVQGSKIVVPDDIPDDDPQKQVVTDYASAYQAKYGSPAGQFGGGAWDSMLLLTTALQNAKLDPCADNQKNRDALKTAMEALDIPGTITLYKFSKDQHGPSGIGGQAVIKVEGGKFALEKAS